MMQILINIDDDLYKKIFSDAEIMIYSGMRSGKTLLATFLRAVRNGTPLPKEYSIMLKCSKCGLDVHSDFESCPRCGAKMKVGE